MNMFVHVYVYHYRLLPGALRHAETGTPNATNGALYLEW